MTMLIENVTVQCSQCDHTYNDWYRGSVNLDLDDFDDEYLDQCSSAVCPHCGHKVYFKTLISKFELAFPDYANDRISVKKLIY